MNKYEAVHDFYLPIIDDDGFESDNDDMKVSKGSIWHLEDNIEYESYLEDKKGNWIGMSKEAFEERFKVVEDE